jgi:hypothetical protein
MLVFLILFLGALLLLEHRCIFLNFYFLKLRDFHMILTDLWELGQVAGGSTWAGADSPCSGSGVVWTESAGYFALDGSLEMPDAIFNALARFPTQDHNALTNSSLDCTWVLYPKYNGTTLFHHLFHSNTYLFLIITYYSK